MNKSFQRKIIQKIVMFKREIQYILYLKHHPRDIKKELQLYILFNKRSKSFNENMPSEYITSA